VKRFGLVNSYDKKPKRRAFEALKFQEMRKNGVRDSTHQGLKSLLVIVRAITRTESRKARHWPSK
jgi:hypothetical protein